MCNCRNQPDALELAPTRDGFLVDKRVVDRDVQLWAELAVCQDCGQRWYVTCGAEFDRRPNVAYRVPANADWRTMKPS